MLTPFNIAYIIFSFLSINHCFIYLYKLSLMSLSEIMKNYFKVLFCNLQFLHNQSFCMKFGKMMEVALYLINMHLSMLHIHILIVL